MSLRIQLATAVAVAATITLATPATAVGADKDSREVASYALTEGGLAKFTKATQNLAAVPGACAKQDDDDGSNSQSIDQTVAKLNAVPGAQSAIQSAGMTTREYVVFMWSILHNGMAAWATSQPGGKAPPGTLQSNIDFYKKHEAQMAALGENDPCDEDAADEEEPSE
jgi:hypothetical protein